MAKRASVRRGQPPPSVPDVDAPAGKYDEPEIERRPDAVPDGTLTNNETGSLAELRLRVETLLQRREPADAEAWQALGPEAPPLLMQLVDDVAIARNAALRDRVLATLGQLGVRAAVPRLGQILLDGAERLATRALAANVLGRIGDPGAITYLAQAIRDSDQVIKRQIALALGRLKHPDGIAHLQALAADSSPMVAEAAVETLRQSEERLGMNLGAATRPPRASAGARKKAAPASARKKATPAPERDR